MPKMNMKKFVFYFSKIYNNMSYQGIDYENRHDIFIPRTRRRGQIFGDDFYALAVTDPMRWGFLLEPDTNNMYERMAQDQRSKVNRIIRTIVNDRQPTRSNNNSNVNTAVESVREANNNNINLDDMIAEKLGTFGLNNVNDIINYVNNSKLNENQLTKMIEQNTTLKNQLNTVNTTVNEIPSLKEQIQQLTQTNTQLQTNKNNEINALQQSLKDMKSAADNEVDKLRNALSNMKGAADMSVDQLKAAALEHIETLERQISDKDTQIATQTNLLRQHHNERENQEQNIESLEQKLSTAVNDAITSQFKDENITSMGELTSKIKNTINERDAAKKELQKYQDALTQLNFRDIRELVDITQGHDINVKDFIQLKNKLGEMGFSNIDDIKTLQKEKELLSKEKQSLTEKMNQQNQTLQKLNTAGVGLSQQNQALTNKLTELNDKDKMWKHMLQQLKLPADSPIYKDAGSLQRYIQTTIAQNEHLHDKLGDVTSDNKHYVKHINELEGKILDLQQQIMTLTNKYNIDKDDVKEPELNETQKAAGATTINDTVQASIDVTELNENTHNEIIDKRENGDYRWSDFSPMLKQYVDNLDTFGKVSDFKKLREAIMNLKDGFNALDTSKYSHEHPTQRQEIIRHLQYYNNKMKSKNHMELYTYFTTLLNSMLRLDKKINNSISIAGNKKQFVKTQDDIEIEQEYAPPRKKHFDNKTHPKLQPSVTSMSKEEQEKAFDELIKKAGVSDTIDVE